MYRDVAQWTTIRRKILEEGASRRALAKQMGLSRHTIRRMLIHEMPLPYKERPPRYPILSDHIRTLDAIVLLNENLQTHDKLSIKDIHTYLTDVENSNCSYSSVRRYIQKTSNDRNSSDHVDWGYFYEFLTKVQKKEAIWLLKSASFENAPLFPPDRAKIALKQLHYYGEEYAFASPRERKRQQTEWVHRALRGELTLSELKAEFKGVSDLDELYDKLNNGTKRCRQKAAVILSHLRGISNHTIAAALDMSRITVRRWRRSYQAGELEEIFAKKKRNGSKLRDEALRKLIFKLLHEPPKDHNINRTSWTMAALCEVLEKQGSPACMAVVRSIVRDAGYKWRKARVVLTSNDPKYEERLSRIHSILSDLGPDEAFFSIDEFGPFAINTKPGRVLVAPGDYPSVPQWQKSKGCLILTAALELSTNQVSHFYSSRKNTAEMIKMAEILIEQYKDKRKLYLSWDAASWHISKRLQQWIETNNENCVHSGRPIVELAPLPAQAQFLNVIESVFSGMARAIIHNSDYQSVDEAKAAIDRYFEERNCHFRDHPQRAGRKIWGKERVKPEFDAANNCKDPRYR